MLLLFLLSSQIGHHSQREDSFKRKTAGFDSYTMHKWSLSRDFYPTTFFCWSNPSGPLVDMLIRLRFRGDIRITISIFYCVTGSLITNFFKLDSFSFSSIGTVEMSPYIVSYFVLDFWFGGVNDTGVFFAHAHEYLREIELIRENTYR